ncbi:MAG: penicillin-binding protein activator LpoB [Burkholderiales bacterium]|nr:penicillin-binding protein activator LpoB [Burkholderiales bacterium]PZN06074.1 MAG: penicillin-binding protein activator LpoB [Pseudomonadota bacterium]
MKLRLIALAGLCALATGCATNSPIVGGNVQYGDAKAVETVTNEFGSTDLQMMAEAMTRSMLQSRVITRAKERPLITVADVKNKTGEYIDTRAITNSIRTQLLKSGDVRFVTDIADMKAQTDELARQNQSGLYKKSTTAKMGRMVGAQYRLEGEITSIVKRTSDIKDVYYKLSMILTDIESGTIEWAEEKDIRKTSRR